MPFSVKERSRIFDAAAQRGQAVKQLSYQGSEQPCAHAVRAFFKVPDQAINWFKLNDALSKLHDSLPISAKHV